MTAKRTKRAVKPRSKKPKQIAAATPIPAAAPASPAKPSYRVERWRSPNAPNPAMLRDVLAREGYTVYQWSDPPGAIYGMHRHDTDQSHWIISGELEIRVEGRGSFSLVAGDRDFMPSATYHSARVVGDEPVLYLVGELPA